MDIFQYCINGLRFSKVLNGVGTLSFDISLNALAKIAKETRFDITQILSPRKRSIYLYIDGYAVWGGFLASVPSIEMSNEIDSVITMEFVEFLGLAAGAYITPFYQYTQQSFTTVAKYWVDRIYVFANNTGGTGDVVPWQLRWNNNVTSDMLPLVDDTIDMYKTLKDFLLEKTDNTTGTGEFDVYVNPEGSLSIHKRYGADLTGRVTLTYPETEDRYGIRSISFPPWNNYFSHYTVVGNGEGFGTGGTAIRATASNNDTLANTGYWEGCSNDSNISIMQTLQNKATGFVSGTETPFTYPTISIGANKINIRPHTTASADIWVGDIINIDIVGNVKDAIPLDTTRPLRIVGMEITINGNKDMEAQLEMGKAR
jgi:hypothetical protein